MAHLQYMPGDPRLVDQLVYELKSKGIFDQFRKECIADVDTKPAYQNLRQRVENSVSTFLSRQCWQPDLNKNQLREKLRKHILDGNYLEQGVERIVDQVVNPKVASVFIPQVEDLVYNYLGISRKKTTIAESSNEQKSVNLLPNDLEAVSPGSVNNDEKEETMEVDGSQQETNMEVDEEKYKSEIKEEAAKQVEKVDEAQSSNISELTLQESSMSIDKENIPFPSDEIVFENIPLPDNSPPKVDLEKIALPKERSVDIPLPEELPADIPLPDDTTDKSKDQYFKPVNSEDDDSSSDSSLRRNMSPLTPIRNYNNENSCDAQQAFENDTIDIKNEDEKEPSSFRFKIDTKSPEHSLDAPKPEKKEDNLPYQFNNQININNFNTPLYEDSSNSHNLQIDYESDANSKINIEAKVIENEQNSEDSKKDKKQEERKSSHKSSHRSRDSHKHSSRSRDKRVESKQSSSRDSSRHDKHKSSRDDKSKSTDKDKYNDKEKPKESDKEKSKEKSEKKDNKDSSRHRSSHKSSHKDYKSHRSSSSSHRHSSKHPEEKKSSSSLSQKDKEKTSDKERSSEKDKGSKDKTKDSRSNSHRSEKDRKSSSSSKSKHEDKNKDKKSKKETDDHYSLSGRGNPNRRSTDRDSNDGSSSSKGSNNPPSSKSSQTKTESKRSSKLDTTSTSGDSTSPSDKENIAYESGTQARELLKHKPIIRIEKNLETPVISPPRLPFVPDVTLRKPKIAANFEEAKKVMKMRKFLEEEQRRMNQEAALLLEFQANVRPSLSQVYSNISGPELEFACVTNTTSPRENVAHSNLMQIAQHIEQMEENENDQVKSEIYTTQEIELTNNLNEAEKPETVLPIVNMETDSSSDLKNDETNKRTKFFEVTIVTEELSENEEIQTNEDAKSNNLDDTDKIDVLDINTNEQDLKYFGEHEKYDAELERARYSEFLKKIFHKELNTKMYLINCDTYVENIFRDASKDFGDFDIVNYHRNGHLKINKPKTIKNLTTEVSLPIDINYDTNDSESLHSNVFSPQKSECSFELSSDYNAKLEEMVNKTSRQQIMEIILGSAIDDTTNMPKIDYFTDSNIDLIDDRRKRKYEEDDDYATNNNESMLSSNKMRRLSTDHISSTTAGDGMTEPNILNATRSKYLGRPGRVGLPKPRRTNLPNSPSSDKSVENYEQNTQTPNGKINQNKPRNKVQRYDTSDLYKPKLHYLSRRNNVT